MIANFIRYPYNKTARRITGIAMSIGIVLLLLAGCNFRPDAEPTATPAPTRDPGVLAAGIAADLPVVATRQAAVATAMQQPTPVLPLGGDLNPEQQLAQELALGDPRFLRNVRDEANGQPRRSEIFGIYPARASDITEATAACAQATCYRVELYNYALNSTTVAVVDVTNRTVLSVDFYAETQPDLPPALTQLAVEIAINAPEVADALGVKPGADAATMPNIKTALNRTVCERSHHLCVAPTFLQEGRALWAIVDLTDARLVGVRWSDLGAATVPPVTEKTLQNEVVYAEFCDKTNALARDGWEMDYILTSSDGLRISGVRYQGALVLDSAKLVDYHVSYSRTDGFGYSDAVGCPIFSQAAVLALEPPQVEDIQEGGQVTGFALVQNFQSELWPLPCNYYYQQRYEFYTDGRFHVKAGNFGRGCGNDGIYRLVFRIALAGESSFAQWQDGQWTPWEMEQWAYQPADAPVSASGDGYQVTRPDSSSFAIAPYWDDPSQPHDAYVYVTRRHADRDEGDADLITIGPCCNEDYQQGPEKFIDPAPEALDAELVLWYVPALKNNDTPGQEYCWADFVLLDGVYAPKTWPCYAGLHFTPLAVGE